MPIQRRLPKVGFVCARAMTHQEVRLSEINAALKDQTGKLIAVDLDFLEGQSFGESIYTYSQSVLVWCDAKSIKLMVPATAGVKKAVQEAGGECHVN